MDTSQATARPNAYSLSILLAAHGRASQLRPAAALWGRLRAAGWVDGVALNSWIGACANNGQLRLALQAFQVRLIHELRVNVRVNVRVQVSMKGVTRRSSNWACANNGQLRLALQAFQVRMWGGIWFGLNEGILSVGEQAEASGRPIM
jgi:hypothetical protein